MAEAIEGAERERLLGKEPSEEGLSDGTAGIGEGSEGKAAVRKAAVRRRSSPVKTQAKKTVQKTSAKTPAKTPAETPAVKVASPVRKVAPSKDEDAKARATVVKKLLKNMEEKLSGKDVKASLGDYIRLVQLQKELDDDAPREIKVTWVEPGTETTGEAKPDTTSGSGE